MEQYSRRFIEELAKHINPTILEFFNKKKNLMNFPTDNAAELIDETLMEYLEGKTSREDLMPIINKIKKSRLQKRATKSGSGSKKQNGKKILFVATN